MLKAWRDVITPHRDVAEGKYNQAEFAADLGQVVRGESNSEYLDPIEFFSRTYLTSGLKTLLVKTLQRLTSGAGERVVQLKTAFGGGKTHSLLALYHLFGGKITAGQSEAVREVLAAAEIETLPQVHTAVIVGTWENPLKATLWGTIAAQLAKSTGKPELYEKIRANDEQGISPGVGLLKEIFDEAGACLILIDELVAYGRKLRKGEIESGGTFGNLITFIQELTEAIKASRNSALVVSIPESNIEVIDDLGREVSAQVQKVIGRVEFVWTPITNVEGYEIVRRRLFKPCRDDRAKKEVCAAFFRMYVDNANDFPYESRQNDYREKLLACYPIHPKLFDYLYDKWTNLEKFQKTRGVLRLMASVIYYLWTHNDSGALIMPGNIPINFASVREELAKLLGGNWDVIINAEVDGDNSKPHELDAQNVRFGRVTAARKVARTIFMGTAPADKQGDIRGVLENEIRLGVIEPRELENISVYNNALSNLQSSLYYLYSRDRRFWFGVNPTLRKLVDDKREQFTDDDVDFAIEERLKNWKERGQFKAVHICPKNSEYVPDEQTARLVILPPKYAGAVATEAAKEILEFRGTIPRRWKNALLFMAADAEKLRVLKDTVRDFLAWSAVIKEELTLNLDALQREDALSNLKSATEDFATKLSQAYCMIFAPEKSDDISSNHPMQIEKIECTKEDNISAASEKFIQEEMLLSSLGCEALRKLLDRFLWRDEDARTLNELWGFFATHSYLPRLIDVNVLINAIGKGVAAKSFALAEDFQDGKYTELKFGDVACKNISLENLLVKAEVAERQLDIKPPPPIEPDDKDNGEEIELPPPPIKAERLSTNFSMDVELDTTRYVKEIKKCVEEIASFLMNLPSAETSIHIAINISVPDGIPQATKNFVVEKCIEQNVDAENYHFEP